MEKIIVDYIVKVLTPRFVRRFNISASEVEQEIRDALETARQTTNPSSYRQQSIRPVEEDTESVDALSSQTVVQLKAKAKEMSLIGYNTLKKQDLIAFIRRAIERKKASGSRGGASAMSSIDEGAAGGSVDEEEDDGAVGGCNVAVAAENKKKVPRTQKDASKKRVIALMKDQTFTSRADKSWTIGDEFDQGGFGCLFYTQTTGQKTKHVIKIEEEMPGVCLFLETAVLRKIGVHKNIVTILDSGKITDRNMPSLRPKQSFYFMVMPLFESIRRKIDGVKMASDVLEGLRHIHEKGYLHLDIKPSNILYDKITYNYVIIDFGMALRYKPETERVANKKQVGNGTPDYMGVGAHEGIMSRKDDVESLLFTILYVTSWTALPWENKQPNEALKLKKEWLARGSLPQPFGSLFRSVREMRHGDTPRYSL